MRSYVYEKVSKATGTTSLVLITGSGASRVKKSLGLYFRTTPKTLAERKEREEKRRIATQVATEHQREILRGSYDIPLQYNNQEDFFAFAWEYVAELENVLSETKKYTAMLRKLENFLQRKSIPFYELNVLLIERFTKYMESQSRGQTARGYLSRLKIILKAAVRQGYIKANPATDVSARQMGKVEKAVLTMQEIATLNQTPLDDDHTKRAFLFSTLTGLRFCDIKELRWSDIKSDMLRIYQRKTGFQVAIPLIPEAIELLGDRQRENDLVFELRTHATTCKNLKRWAKDAGIDKTVTFHVGRHSSATNLIAQNVNIAVASKILGHRNIAMTQRYVQISDELKKEALLHLSLTNVKTINNDKQQIPIGASQN